ncbi:uncharacterized protein LOC143615069 [Bidens hawaiensis]|uniref:uncharacterized protein LOC143615069 n=1 Tax=Bidens hawaiensis TaxID=980011 RepID=UPI00404B7551
MDVGPNRPDHWVWAGAGTNKFSVAAVRELLERDHEVSKWRIIEWSKWVPRKCQIFFWRAEMNRIPTLEAFQIRNIPLSSVHCSCCGGGIETIDHLFTSCGYTAMVWDGLASWCKIHRFSGSKFEDVVDFHNSLSVPTAKKDVIHGIVIIACWRIWKARNEKMFSNKVVRIEEIIGEIKSFSFLWYCNRPRLKPILWEDWCSFKLI